MNYLFECSKCKDRIRVHCKLSERSSYIGLEHNLECLGTLSQVVECPMLPKTNAYGEKVYSDCDKLMNQVRDDREKKWNTEKDSN